MIVPSDFLLERQANLVRVNVLGGPLASVRWRLFVNDFEPNSGTLISDFVEASFPGYSERNNQTWQLPVLIGGEWITTSAALYQWATLSGDSQPLYGWYSVFTGPGGPLWILAERFDPAPIVIPEFKILTVLPSKGDRRWPVIG